MSIQTIFDEEKQVAITTGNGMLTFQEIEENMFRVMEADDFKPDRRAVIDFRDAKIVLSMDGLKRVANSAHSLREKIGKAKWAIVASDDSIVEAARMYKTVSNHSQVEIMIFKEIEDAYNWLGVDL